MTTERDIHNQIRFAEKKGEEKRGVETARRMLAKNYPIAEIAEISGLTVEQVEAL